MNILPYLARARCPCLGTAAALLILSGCCCGSASAADCPSGSCSAFFAFASEEVPVPLVSPPLFASWVDKFFAPFEGALNTQKRMIQFATVGLILALWIIWWRK